MFELTVKDEFAAAHYLRNYPGACERPHGHNWKVEIAVCGTELNEIHVLIDFKDLKRFLKEVLEELDHRDLNEHPAFQDKNPSSENIARFIFENLKEKLAPYPVKLVRVSVWETERSCASYLAE
ncbi:6-carboxytetrahydropterin synthase QueD [Thermodesulfatator atlanticus]|uniref:6-carboxytetrahydropterin synthase QueD n=1 Tax=Thermodesulfatator atlanticus TaxID=501497 RepID=UPI0003B73258|nr:6-carboxytetrahydropterin synthase QueD [Thermodesulfatator atlanticus]